MEYGGGIGTTTGFGGGGAATCKLAEASLSSRRAATVFGPAPMPCSSSTVRSSNFSTILTWCRYSATCRSGCFNWTAERMNAVSLSTVRLSSPAAVSPKAVATMSRNRMLLLLCQQIGKGGCQIAVTEFETGGLSGGWEHSLAGEDDIRHLPEHQPQRERGHGENGWPVQDSREFARELRVGYRMGSSGVDGAVNLAVPHGKQY